MKQHYQTYEEMKALREMCRAMIDLSTYHPDFNHIIVGGYFVDGGGFSYPYAMICVKGLDEAKKHAFVSLCNTYHRNKFTMFGQVTEAFPCFDSKEMEKFVEIVTGDFCNIYTRRTIKFNNN